MDEPSLPPALRWIYRLENPFFLRDTRTVSRRPGGVAGGILARQVLFLCLPLLVVENLLPFLPRGHVAREALALALLGVGHAGSCAAAGGCVGLSVLRDEYRRGTLDSLRLLPTRPWDWLLQKLLFPLFALLTVWLSALPCYGALALRGYFLPHQLLPGAVWALAVGLFAFAAALAAPPEGAVATIKGERGPLARRSLEAGQLLQLWLAVCLVRPGIDWVLWNARFHAAPWKSTTPVFTTWMRMDIFLALQLGLYAVAAVSTAISLAAPDNRRVEVAARGCRYVAGMTACTLFVGGLPVSIPLGARLPLLAILPVLTLVILRDTRRKASLAEDGLAAVEVRWCGERWDNAVLLRDLRAMLRHQSVRRLALRRCGEQLLIAVALAGLSFLPVASAITSTIYGSPPSVAALPFRIAANLTFFAPMSMFLFGMVLGEKAREQWLKESQVGMLPQLLSTPLPAEALVCGRWGASVVTAASYTVPALLGVVIGSATLRMNHPDLVIPYLALSLLSGSSGVLGGAASARPVWPGMALASVSGVGLAGGSLLGLGELLVAGKLGGLLVMRVLAGSQDDPTLLGAMAVLAALLNGCIAAVCYRSSVAEIGRMRTADIG